VLPFATPPADTSANIGGGDDAKLPPSGNTLMPDVPPLLLGPSDGNKTDQEAHLRLLSKLSSLSKYELETSTHLPPFLICSRMESRTVPCSLLAR
jgi:hypothetical protein